MNVIRYMPAILTALLVVGTAFAGEPGTALKVDAIKAEPFKDAKTVGSLAQGDKVDIQKTQSGWVQVKSAKGSGWVRMLSIRRGEARKSGGEVSGVLSLASGRSGTGSVVATTGIRGLSEEELKTTTYNEPELKKTESYLVSQAEAKKFATAGKLVARKVDYLPVPE